jgi:hypothetical protein
VIERELAPAAIVIVKSIRKIFAVITGFLVHLTWSGIQNRVTRWTLATPAPVVAR